MIFYRVVWWIVAPATRLIWRVEVHGKERLPSSGGFVLAPSHRSMMDIPLLSIVTQRRIRFMGKVQVFKIPILGSLFKALGGFPVARDGNDRKAVRDSMDMLHTGEVLAVFPEGTRQHGPKIQPLQPGAAYLALRAGVPVVPIAMAGSEEILRDHKAPIPRFGKVVIVVGEPIEPPAREKRAVPRADVDAVTAQLHESLQHAFDEAYSIRSGV